MEPRARQRRSTRLILSFMLPVIVVLCIESCSRAVVTLAVDLTPEPTPAIAARAEAVPSRELGWQRAPNFEGRLVFDNGEHVRKHDGQGFLAYDTAQIHDTSRPRIVAIGDSNTYGWGVAPEAAWVEVLDRSLPDVNVINLGWLGYSSYQGYRVLLEYGDRLKPQLIIASFNYNDRRYVHDRNIDREEKFARNFDALRTRRSYDWLEKVYTARLLRSVLTKAGLLKHDVSSPGVDVGELEARVPPEEYRENLRKIAEYGRGRNIPVVFLLLKDNPYYTRQIWSGIKYNEAGDYERATRAFTTGLANKVSGTLARKYLALMYRDRGEVERANAIGRVERQLEPIDGLTPIYLDADYNRIMLEVGKEYGVEVVDAREMLDADPAVFIDMCHPDEVGHARIAGLMLETIKAVMPGWVEPHDAK